MVGERKTVALRQSGFTLLEMLVATAASLTILGVTVALLGQLTDALNDSRSIAQTEAQLRAVNSALLADLQGYTVRPNRQRFSYSADEVSLQPVSAATGNGYFEYIEGPNTDSCLFEDQANAYTPYVNPWFDKAQLSGGSAGPTPTSDDRIVGDTDDVLMLTTQAFGEPFSGRLGTQQIDSEYAEVAWFCLPTPGSSNPVTYTLYRRQLLVMGYVNSEPFASRRQRLLFDNEPGLDFDASWARYFENSDVSCRRQAVTEGGGTAYYLFPNTLQDLTKRENRFLHDTPNVTIDVGGGDRRVDRARIRQAPGNAPPAYPFFSRAGRSSSESVFDPNASVRSGDDVVMTNVLAFDVQVLDVQSIWKLAGPWGSVMGLMPGDPGYWVLPATNGWFLWIDGAPAMFSDLNYARSRGSNTASSKHASSESYLRGKNPDLSRSDVSGMLVDDVFDTYCDTYPGTVAPRSWLYGLQITVRVLDPGTKQVRQLTARWSPE